MLSDELPPPQAKIIHNLFYDWDGIFAFSDTEFPCKICGAPHHREIKKMVAQEIEHMLKRMPWYKRLFFPHFL